MFRLSMLLVLAFASTATAEDKVAIDPYDQSKVALEVPPPADFKGKVVLLIAGKQSHGPGDHRSEEHTSELQSQ